MLKLAGFKPLVAGAKPKAQPAPVMEETKEFDVDAALALIRQQKELIVKQQAQLQQQKGTIASLMGVIDVLKKKKASPAESAKPAQKEADGTMAQLRKRFGL